MEDLIKTLLNAPAFKQALSDKKFCGLLGSGKAALISALNLIYKKILIVTISSSEAQWLHQEIKFFSPAVFLDILAVPDAPYGERLSSSEIVGHRLKVLNNIHAAEKYIAIAPLRAVLYKTANDFAKKIVLQKGKRISLDNLTSKLADFGYKRLSAVGERGEFSVRGGIVDIFPSSESEPVRVEFYGDEIDSIKNFDPTTQRSKNSVSEAAVLKNMEPRDKNIFEVLAGDILVVFDEENILNANADKFLEDFEASKEMASFSEIKKSANRFEIINFSSWVAPGHEPIFTSPPSFINLHEEIEKENKNIKIVSRHAARFPKALVGQLRGGFEFDGWMVLTDSELFNEKPIKPKTAAKKNEGVGADIRADFAIGGYVVHEDYGIGIYRGLQKIEEGEFILIEFAGADKLYVPPALMGKVEKYASEEGYLPRLSKMGGAGWANLKGKVKKSVKDLTADLLKLYSERKKTRKDPYPLDDAWQRELADSFPYEETCDQLKAIEDIKKDLESDIPMDRLLCGDVGYGKTEVALRAIVKVAGAGRQVAILVPTTILAEQHYHYFNERLSTFPFKIASLSRFRSKEDQHEIVKRLKGHELDIVVGTHRLLQKDVEFSNLGLLIVDEEHRFGVAHKEKFKKMKKNIDVISMTATPIPRTLYFSLSGSRDMSLIQTPPADRSPVKTYVAPFNETLIKEAVLYEMDRGGQVFFVHNRVETIEKVAAFLRQLLPDAGIVAAHGRMREADLEAIMDEFLNKEYDVLICTAIIESGLDIPNVNTILIDRADKFGLAQLYQLRGRVGRSPVKAYAYLLYHKDEVLTQTAISRLQAIQEFTTLGSGYKLALRDLEIRGSGNLLGAEQHGHMLSVGFDLYCELLSEAVNEIKGIKQLTPRQVAIELMEEAHIPSSYIEDEQQRIAIYRRLNLLSSEKDIEDFKKELADRFGKIPPLCFKLFDIVKLKVLAQKAGIKSIRGDAVAYVEWFDGRAKKFKLTASDRIKEIISRTGL